MAIRTADNSYTAKFDWRVLIQWRILRIADRLCAERSSLLSLLIFRFRFRFRSCRMKKWTRCSRSKSSNTSYPQSASLKRAVWCFLAKPNTSQAGQVKWRACPTSDRRCRTLGRGVSESGVERRARLGWASRRPIHRLWIKNTASSMLVSLWMLWKQS